ncbi:alpha/beta hydrolase [Rhodoligotrophos ferricapiens]|uniref:alpha/beta hydrolase n=1 Tax=Rhodoligotrophos ferricapiens TaxID=3069264 RepID=UPI00315CED50
MARWLLWSGGLALALAAAGFIAIQLSPWPEALFFRYLSDREAARMTRALEKHVPPGTAVQRNVVYDPGDADARLDLYYPTTVESADRLTAIIWIHGGGWISGSKEMVAGYARILAARGYVVAAIGYSLAPAKTYPTPVKQVNAALAFLARNAGRFHIDPARFVLAGDSAGSQIAAQLANIISVPEYSRTVGITPAIAREQLRGAILFCGAYDLSLIKLEGPFHSYLETVLWSYTGVKDFATDRRIAPASVIHYLTQDFPPAFISAGNDDPLLPQSTELADVLAAKGVPVDTLFFPQDHKPALPHEYQFDLDGEAGQLALVRVEAFLGRL